MNDDVGLDDPKKRITFDGRIHFYKIWERNEKAIAVTLALGMFDQYYSLCDNQYVHLRSTAPPEERKDIDEKYEQARKAYNDYRMATNNVQFSRFKNLYKEKATEALRLLRLAMGDHMFKNKLLLPTTDPDDDDMGDIEAESG